jgi:tetratricopeptide (TPR) repeat protein
MKKRIAFIALHLLVFACTCSYTYASSDTIPTLPADTTAYIKDIELMMGLAKKHAKSEPETSYLYAQKALQSALQAGDTLHQAYALYFIGNYYYIAGKFALSLQTYQRMLELHQLTNQQNEVAYSLQVMGNIYLDMNKNAEALDHYIRALQLFEEAGKKDETSSVFSNIGSVYIQEGNYPKAREYYQKALDLANGPDKLEKKAVYINNIGKTYFLEKELDKAFSYFKEALTIKEALEDNYGMIVPMKNMASIYAARKNYPEASRLLQKALSLTRKHHYRSYETLILSEMAFGLYVPQRKYEQAKIYGLQAVQLAEENQDIKRLQTLYKSLPEVFIGLQQETQAALYSQKYATLTDSLARLVEHGKIKALEKELDTVRKEINQKTTLPAVKETPAKNNANLWTTLLFLALGVFSVSIILFNKNIKKQPPLFSHQANFVEEKEVEPEPAQHWVQPATTQVASVAPPKAEYIQVIHQEGELPLSLDKILWFEKEERQYFACTLDKKYRTRHTISQLEALLENQGFFRINRAVLINLDYLCNYSHWEYDKYIIRMKNPEKTQFVMSRDRLKILNKKLNL